MHGSVFVFDLHLEIFPHTKISRSFSKPQSPRSSHQADGLDLRRELPSWGVENATQFSLPSRGSPGLNSLCGHTASIVMGNLGDLYHFI